jgi:hypothetical protein
MTTQRAEAAVVAALAPICVEKFQHQADAPAKLVEFNKVSSWKRRSVIEKGGWATMPGSDTPNSAVASACAEKLGSLTWRGRTRSSATGGDDRQLGRHLRRKRC